MARTRSIKPGFFDNEVLSDLPPLTRLLFIGLWCIADREGRLEDRPKRIKKAILGYDDISANDVSTMLQGLHNTGFIIRYTTQGEDFIQIVNFSKHQNPHMKEKGSEIPPPSDEYHESTRQAPDKHQTSTIQSPPFTVNRLPSTGNLSPYNEETPEKTCATADMKEPNASETVSKQRFDLFWSAYPKKVGKKDAQRAWKNAKVNTELFEKIMNAIGKARTTDQWQRENGRYIPNPSTWLNQGRWDDEIKEAIANGEHQSYDGSDSKEPNGTNSWRSGSAAPGFKLAGAPDDPDGD